MLKAVNNYHYNKKKKNTATRLDLLIRGSVVFVIKCFSVPREKNYN